MISPDRTIVNQLTSLGLTEKESVIYLTTIESGISTARQLSKNSGINRGSTYAVLESLIAKGLVEKQGATGTNMYEAFEPETLLHKATEMERKQKEIHGDIDALIPELNALSPTLALHPRLKFYEGKGGIETAMHDITTIEAGDMVRSFAVDSVIFKCRESQIVRIISPYRDGAIPKPSDKSVSICLVPAKTYDFSSDIRIYADKIVLISEHESFAAIIEDHYLAEVMRETFDLAWEEAKRLDIKIRAKNRTAK